LDCSFTERTVLGKPVVHGVLIASYVSALVGMRLPGPGSLWAQQTFRWLEPVFIGDELTISLTVTHKSVATRTVVVALRASDQRGRVVMEGTGTVKVLELQPSGED